MDLGLKNKVALVAGSSTGLGRAVAEELAAEGAHLILCARNAERLKQTRQEIVTRYGVEALDVAADLSRPDGPERVVSAALTRFVRVDILVNNAGGPPPGTFDEVTPEQWEFAFHLTLESALSLTRAVLPGMKKNRWGRILNITSLAVKQPVPNLILSNSLRAAVTGFARTLADEIATYGITVNNILPGYTRTRRLEELASNLASKKGVTVDSVFEQWESSIPMRRVGEPSEFAALAAFLVSERASFVTGTSVPVDGGAIRALF